jgi:hypothetical protein
MASSIFNNDVINQDINFLNEHIGGSNNDNDDIFKKQMILNKKIKKYDNVFNPINNKFNNQTRLNQYETMVGDSSLSNDLIIEDDFKNDPFFDYLIKKNINTINTRTIITNNYINIDSTLQQTNNANTYIQLNNDPLTVFMNSNILRILVPENKISKFNIGQKITLQGIIPQQSFFSNVNFNFIDNTNIVKINIIPSFTSSSKFYNILMRFEGIENVDDNNYFENIPLSVLNQIQTININNNNEIYFKIPLTFHSNNIFTLVSNCRITFLNISNVPINIINAYLPIGDLNLTEFQTIYNIQNNFLEIELPITFNIKIPELTFGGKNIQIGIFENNNYISNYTLLYNLNKEYSNIISIKIINSIISIPSTNTDNFIINSNNNKFYWRNLMDNQNFYSVELPFGLYNYDDLQTILYNLIKKVKRNTNVPNIFPFNDIELIFSPKINLFSFKSINKFILPQCFKNIEIYNNVFNIIIEQKNHTYQIGDKILIENAIDYYKIPKENINKIHIITNILSKDLYQISLININPLPIDAGNTKGGFQTQILSDNSIQLLFNFPNTIGEILNFKNVGFSSSVTPFSNHDNEFTINNNQPYLYNTLENKKEKKNLNPNYNYFLLLASNLNKCYNPLHPQYFYKFTFNNLSTSKLNLLENTYVDAPLIFNPPLSSINKFEFTFINPKGEPFDYTTFNYSLTIQIDTVSTVPENTQLNTNVGKI